MNRDQRTICSYEKGRIEPPLEFFYGTHQKNQLKNIVLKTIKKRTAVLQFFVF